MVEDMNGMHEYYCVMSCNVITEMYNVFDCAGDLKNIIIIRIIVL